MAYKVDFIVSALWYKHRANICVLCYKVRSFLSQIYKRRKVYCLIICHSGKYSVSFFICLCIVNSCLLFNCCYCLRNALALSLRCHSLLFYVGASRLQQTFRRDGLQSSVGYRKMKTTGFDDNLHFYGRMKREAAIFFETFVLM